MGGVHVMGIIAVEQNGAAGGLIDLGQQVENGGLTGTVGTDEARDLGAADGQIEVLHGLEAAEGDAQIDALQNGALVNVPVRDHVGRGDRNQFGFGSHVRQPPFLRACRA